MPSSEAMLYCPNSSCQSPNPEHQNFCQQCGVSLTKRYLWVVGDKNRQQPGEIVSDRYLVKQAQVWLDTQPHIPPIINSNEIPDAVVPYLRLFPYRLHLPQPYSLFKPANAEPVLLLDNAPLDPKTGQLLPPLTHIWPTTTPLRQLHLLWQMAHLWQPFSVNGVASSLLTPNLLKIDRQLVRVLELQLDRKTVSLKNLGQLWLHWVDLAHPSIKDFVNSLCQSLISAQISQSEQLIGYLDQQLAAFNSSQSLQFEIATLSDTGPSRRRNEDSCYPPMEEAQKSTDVMLTVVCDGIGGHEGGNVASNLAIETVKQGIAQTLANPEVWNWANVSTQLDQIVCQANDAISDRNDSERRHERQRMGTTLVMAVANPKAATPPELYTAHIGDSRIYWITRSNCHQVTLDDDVASREVRLGYAFYQDALQYPGSGSLIQALGMSSSDNLRPTVQRFILDEDCIFLLTSDGLSDRDKVEQHWESELLPIFSGQKTLVQAAHRLIEIANTENGHDNVTVGLIYCRVPTNPEPVTAPPITLTAPLPALIPASTEGTTTQILHQSSRSTRILPVILSIFILAITGSGLAYLLMPLLRSSSEPDLATNPQPLLGTPTPIPTLPDSSPLDPPPLETQPLAAVQVKTLLQLVSNPTPPLTLKSTLDPEPQTTSIPVPNQTLLQVIQIRGKQELSNPQTWLQLKVCNPPASSAVPTIQPGTTGWILDSELLPYVEVKANGTTQECSPSADKPTSNMQYYPPHS